MRIVIISVFALALGFFSGASFLYATDLSSLVFASGTGAKKAQVSLDFKNGNKSTVLFVGDIMLSRSIGGKIRDAGDARFPFLKIAEEIQSADIAFGNLEGPISDNGTNQGGLYSFRAEPSVVRGLSFAGFDVLSIANNHIFDWGETALTDTIDILNKNGIHAVGAGENKIKAITPVVMDANGARVGFLAYTNVYPEKFLAGDASPGVSEFNLETAFEQISSLKKEADIIAVSFHWGNEYETRSSRIEQDIAHALIEYGADIIVGHHPHVVQEIERYKDGWIMYSLGNFVFDQGFSEETMSSLAVRVIIEDKKVVGIEQIEIKLNADFQPELSSL